MKKTLFLIVLFSVLLTLVLFSSDEYHENSSTNKTNIGPNITKKQIYKIELIKSSQKNILAREGNTWKLIEPVSAVADQDAVLILLKGLEGMTFKTIISSNRKKRSKFNVDEATGLFIKTYDKKGSLLSAFIIGKSTPDFSHTYVRMKGSNDVYWAKGFQRHQFDRGTKMWRDRKILTFPKEDAKKIVLTSKESTIIFKKDTKEWNIVEPISSLADKNILNTMINILSNFVATGFEDTLSKKETSLEEPVLTVSVELSNGKSKTVIIGKEKGSNTFVKNINKDQIFIAPKIRINSMTKKVSEYKAKNDAEEDNIKEKKFK